LSRHDSFCEAGRAPQLESQKLPWRIQATPFESCYTFSMKKKTRRVGATETFSVSVDATTKQALRKLANSDFNGNLSALVTELAEDARRRMAAGAYLKRRGVEQLTKAEAELVEASIDREVSAWKKRRKRRAA